MSDKVDKSLDDIIKEQKGKGFRGRGGRSSGFRGVRGGMIMKFPRFNSGMRFIRRESGFGFRGQRGSNFGSFNQTRKPNSTDSKISITNLDFGVNDNDIKELFGSFGVMIKAAVNYNQSGRSMGTAEVVYTTPTSALAAATHYNNVPLDGRPMKIMVVAAGAPTSQGGFRGGRPARFFNNQGNNFRGGFRRGFGQNFRGGARGRGGRGRGGRGGRPAPPSKEDLDKQLEQYVSAAN